MTEPLPTVERTAGFVKRLLARSRTRAHGGSRLDPLEMTLHRFEPGVTRTIVQRTAPSLVSHHHDGPEIRVELAMHVAARSLRSPGPAAAEPAVVRREPLRTVVVHRGGDPAPSRTASSVSVPPAPHIELHPPFRPSQPVAAMHRGSSFTPTVVTTVVREQRVRLDTEVRRTRLEVAAPVVGQGSTSSARPAELPEPPPTLTVRRRNPPASPPPVSLTEVDLGRLADRVVHQIQRRATTQRERRGGR